MSGKEKIAKRPPAEPAFKDPFLGIDPNFTLNRGDAASPNSGPEYNPVLERPFPWPDYSDEIKEIKTINQQDTEALREESGELPSQPKKV